MDYGVARSVVRGQESLTAQSGGLRMWAMLTPPSPVFTRPTYSSTGYGLLPAAVTRVGFSIRVGMVLLLSAGGHFHLNPSSTSLKPAGVISCRCPDPPATRHQLSATSSGSTPALSSR